MRYFFVFFLLWSSIIFADGSCPNNQIQSPLWHTVYISGAATGVELTGSSLADICGQWDAMFSPVGPFDVAPKASIADMGNGKYLCEYVWQAGGTWYNGLLGVKADDTSTGDCGCTGNAAGTTEWYNSDGSFSCVPPPLPPPPPPAPTCSEDTLYTGGCETDKKACADSGGSFGFVGSGSDMKSTCVPADYMGADGLPPCSEGLYPIAQDAGDVTCSAMPSPAPDGSQDTTGDGNTDGNAGNTDPGTGDGGTAGTGSTYGNGAAADTDGDGTSDGASVACDPATDASCIAGADTNGDGSPDSSAAPSDGCDAPPSCDGDAIQCAILFQSYENACTSRNFDAAKAEAATGLQARGRAAHDAVIGPRTDAAGVLAPLTSITGASGSCPAPYTIALGALGNVVMSYDAFCSLAGRMRPFVLALFWFLAGRIVLSSLLGKGD